MGLAGWLTGLILLVFKDSSGLALSDLLLHQAVGTTSDWGELEESAAKETTNIVGCAYVNALASHLPRTAVQAAGGEAAEPGKPEASGDLVPTPPTFVHEFAGSLLEFAFMEQAMELDQVLVIRSDLRGRPGRGSTSTGRSSSFPAAHRGTRSEASLAGARVASRLDRITR